MLILFGPCDEEDEAACDVDGRILNRWKTLPPLALCCWLGRTPPRCTNSACSSSSTSSSSSLAWLSFDFRVRLFVRLSCRKSDAMAAGKSARSATRLVAAANLFISRRTFAEKFVLCGEV